MEPATSDPIRDLGEKVDAILTGMSPVEKEDAISKLQGVLDKQYMLLMKGEPEVCKCPHCNSEEVSRYGHDKAGRQRYICKSCKKVFSSATQANLLSYSKLDLDVWKKYCECFVDRKPLRECASICGVSLSTSFYMRRRILELIFTHLPSFELNPGSGVELDETFFRESLKGNHIIPRKAHKRGNSSHKRGLSEDLLCVVTGATSSGDVFFDIAGKGQLTKAAAEEILGRRICSGTIVTTDKQKAYRSVLKEIGVACHKMFDDKEHKTPFVDNYHSLLKRFIWKFRGISSKWLEQYLGWHKWTRYFTENTLEVLINQITSGHYNIRRKDLFV